MVQASWSIVNSQLEGFDCKTAGLGFPFSIDIIFFWYCSVVSYNSLAYLDRKQPPLLLLFRCHMHHPFNTALRRYLHTVEVEHPNSVNFRENGNPEST